MKHLMLFLMMLATVAAVAAETDGWRDLSGQTDRSAGFVLADGEFPTRTTIRWSAVRCR